MKAEGLSVSLEHQCRRRERIIDRLRRVYPGKWIYDHGGFEWVHADGSYVHWVSALTPRHDGDDDSFTSELWHYQIPGAKHPIRR